jgi:hypothetical protein
MWEKLHEETISFEPGKIHVVKTVLELTSERGTADYFGEQTEFSVVKKAEKSGVTTSHYDSPEKMPDEYIQKWKLLYGNG